MKTGDKIIITKPGKFQNLTGEIISNNELADKPLTVDLNPYGVWSFKLDEVKFGNISDEENQQRYDEGLKVVDNFIQKNTQKRKYTKRSDAPKEVKPKRKYSPRKPKTI